MSKSLGNGIDPLDVIARFGADPLRYTVVAGMGLGVDIIFDPTISRSRSRRAATSSRSCGTSAASCSRTWEHGAGAPLSEIDPDRLTRSDEWILARLDAAIAECDARARPGASEKRSLDGARADRRITPQRFCGDGTPVRVERARGLVSRSGEGAAH
jgi:valyl-tRNA synthetase